MTSSTSEKTPYANESEEVKLHGSALVFSKKFIEKYDYCFHPQTFMYNEESILNYIANRDKLVTLYYPKIKLYHKEDGATNKFLKSKKRKRSFYYKNFIHSAKILLKLMSKKNSI